MSVSTLLAFVLAGAAAKVKSVQVARRSEEPEPKEDLARALADRDAEIAELRDAIATANAQARRDQELIDIWRERALANVPQLQPVGVPHQIALQQAAAQLQVAQAQQSMLAQYNQQAAMNSQNFGAQYQNQLLGAQTLIDAELFCNCVPSRSQVWAADRTD